MLPFLDKNETLETYMKMKISPHHIDLITYGKIVFRYASKDCKLVFVCLSETWPKFRVAEIH